MTVRPLTPSYLRRAAPYLVLSSITLIVFSPVFTHDFLRYDDTVYVTENLGVKAGLSLAGLRYAFTEIVSSNWHPLTILSHQFDVTLFGLRAPAHHGVNVLFHVANACLLFYLMRAMTGATLRSLFVAVLFAVHPLHVESVAWVSERKDVLSTFFMLLAMIAYVRFVAYRRIGAYVALVSAYALALLSKPMPVTLPFLLLLLDYWPLQRGENLRGYLQKLPRLMLEKAPLFALSAISSVITYSVQQRTGATRGLETVGLGQRVETAIVAYAEYLAKMVAPVRLAPHYPLAEPSYATLTASVVLLLLLTTVAIALIRARPYLAVGWFWYLGALVPVIGLVQIGNQALADRYTYVPLIGIFIAMTWVAGDTVVKVVPRWAAWAMVAAVVAVLSFLAFNQARYWKDSETLFTHTLTVSPNSAVAHTVLGLTYAKEEKHDLALTHFQRAQELDSRTRDAAFNLGTALLRVNRPGEAIPFLQAATTAYDKPADAYANLGMALLQLNRIQEAADAFELALSIDDAHAEARINLGIAAGMSGDIDLALRTLAEAVRLAPENPDAHFNYGIALMNSGRAEDAVIQFQEALRLRPNFPDAKAFLDQVMTPGQSRSIP